MEDLRKVEEFEKVVRKPQKVVRKFEQVGRKSSNCSKIILTIRPGR